MPLAFGIGKSRGSVFDPAIEACNYIQFYWNWTDGKDFDLRAEFIRPTQLAGQVVGTDKLPQITDGGGSVTYMKWGGDNQEDTVGYEGIYIDVDALKQVPGGLTQNIIELDLRAIWRAEIGTDPVIVKASGWQGGTVLLEDETPNVPGYGFLNPTAFQSFPDFKQTEGKQLTDTNRENNGQRMCRVKIDLNSYTIQLIEDD